MSNDILGIIGAIALLVCFFLNQINFLSNKSPWYDLGNAVGGALLTVYAYNTGSWPFVALELVWTGVSLRDLIGYFGSHEKS